MCSSDLRSNSDIVNFLFSLLSFGIPYFIFFGFSFTTILIFSVIHFLFFWEFLIKYKKFKLVSDKDREEIDEVIQILESALKTKENKKPLK